MTLITLITVRNKVPLDGPMSEENLIKLFYTIDSNDDGWVTTEELEVQGSNQGY